MRPVNVELTMGHDIGISKSYYKPTEKEVLEDYVKAVDILSVNNTGNKELESKVIELTNRQDEIALMKIKHEREMHEMDHKLSKIMSIVQQNPKLAHAKPEALVKENRT
jgi:hypothetical protein